MKVLTVGGAMMDTIAIIDSNRIERVSMRNAESSFLMLEEGRKTEATDVSTHCGGGAINAAVSAARLGADTATLAKLGRDQRADAILTSLAEEGVSTRYVVRDARAPTGASVLISSHDRNAAVFTFRGANTLLEPVDMKKDAFGADLVLIMTLSNASADCFPLIIEMAKKGGALVAANPGVRQLSARGSAFLDALAHIDILSLNSAEAGTLVPMLTARFGEHGPLLPADAGETLPRLALRGLVSGGFDMSLAAFFAAMRQLGPNHVVVTDGGHGVFVGHAAGISYCPIVATTVAGTAGAGDAFTSTFSTFIAEGRPIEDALRAAAINAASVCEHIDTQTGLLKRDEIERRITALAPRLPIRHWPAAV